MASRENREPRPTWTEEKVRLALVLLGACSSRVLLYSVSACTGPFLHRPGQHPKFKPNSTLHHSRTQAPHTFPTLLTRLTRPRTVPSTALIAAARP